MEISVLTSTTTPRSHTQYAVWCIRSYDRKSMAIFFSFHLSVLAWFSIYFLSLSCPFSVYSFYECERVAFQINCFHNLLLSRYVSHSYDVSFLFHPSYRLVKVYSLHKVRSFFFHFLVDHTWVFLLVALSKLVQILQVVDRNDGVDCAAVACSLVSYL